MRIITSKGTTKIAFHGKKKKSLWMLHTEIKPLKAFALWQRSKTKRRTTHELQRKLMFLSPLMSYMLHKSWRTPMKCTDLFGFANSFHDNKGKFYSRCNVCVKNKMAATRCFIRKGAPIVTLQRVNGGY